MFNYTWINSGHLHVTWSLCEETNAIWENVSWFVIVQEINLWTRSYTVSKNDWRPCCLNEIQFQIGGTHLSLCSNIYWQEFNLDRGKLECPEDRCWATYWYSGATLLVTWFLLYFFWAKWYRTSCQLLWSFMSAQHMDSPELLAFGYWTMNPELEPIFCKTTWSF